MSREASVVEEAKRDAERREEAAIAAEEALEERRTVLAAALQSTGEEMRAALNTERQGARQELVQQAAEAAEATAKAAAAEAAATRRKRDALSVLEAEQRARDADERARTSALVRMLHVSVLPSGRCAPLQLRHLPMPMCTLLNDRTLRCERALAQPRGQPVPRQRQRRMQQLQH